MKVPVLLPNIFDHPFTYTSKEKLKIGDYVEVPFGNKKMIGIIWDNFEEGPKKKFKIKDIIKKFTKEPLENKTIKFLNWFSDYNIVPKGMALKLHLINIQLKLSLMISSYLNIYQKNMEYTSRIIKIHYMMTGLLCILRKKSIQFIVPFLTLHFYLNQTKDM